VNTLIQPVFRASEQQWWTDLQTLHQHGNNFQDMRDPNAPHPNGAAHGYMETLAGFLAHAVNNNDDPLPKARYPDVQQPAVEVAGSEPLFLVVEPGPNARQPRLRRVPLDQDLLLREYAGRVFRVRSEPLPGEDDVCPICHERLKQTTAAEDGEDPGEEVEHPGCGHRFHRNCIAQWHQQAPQWSNPSCAVCRQEAPRGSVPGVPAEGDY
jgi:hypothetical protein